MFWDLVRLILDIYGTFWPLQIVDNYSMDVTIRGEPYTLRLFDMHGQEEYERLRPLSYPDTDVLLVCFSVVSPQSYESVKKKVSRKKLRLFAFWEDYLRKIPLQKPNNNKNKQ